MYKSYDELVICLINKMFLPKKYLKHDNTNIMADSLEDFDLDMSLSYPKLV